MAVPKIEERKIMPGDHAAKDNEAIKEVNTQHWITIKAAPS